MPVLKFKKQVKTLNTYRHDVYSVPIIVLKNVFLASSAPSFSNNINFILYTSFNKY